MSRRCDAIVCDVTDVRRSDAQSHGSRILSVQFTTSSRRMVQSGTRAKSALSHDQLTELDKNTTKHDTVCGRNRMLP